MGSKKQIIEAATELFSKNGFGKTSITSICNHLGVSKGLIFHYFRDKNSLLREVFLKMEGIYEEVDCSFDHSLPAINRLEHLLEMIFESMADDKEKCFYLLYFQLITHPDTRKILSDLIKRREEHAISNFESILSEYPSLDSYTHSRKIAAEIEGIALNYLLSHETYPLKRVSEEYIKQTIEEIYRKISADKNLLN